MIKRLASIAVLSVFWCFSYAQDIHFSQFNRSYLNLNPALTGSFEGTYRFNGNFKNQWSSVSEPYRTFSGSVEGKSLIETFPDFHFGLLLYNDEAGVGGLRSTQVNTSIAYVMSLNNDSSLLVKGGIQFGYASRSINFNRFSFDEQYDGRRFNESLETGEDFDRSSYGSLSVNSGMALEFNQEERKSFNAGIAFFNLTQPNQSFQNISVPLDVRTSLYLSADYYLSEKMDIMPSLLFSSQGEFRELLIGSDLRYRFENRRTLASNLYGGVWYRNQDAIILSTGLDYLQWNLGISYDINISDLESASNKRGGLEIAITYIFKDFKPIIRRYKVCPDFM